MAKDVLNKSKLTETEQKLMNKVLSGDLCKPNYIHTTITKIERMLTYRMKYTICIYTLTLIPALILYGIGYHVFDTSNILYECVVGFVGDYLVVHALLTELRAKWILSMLSKIRIF